LELELDLVASDSGDWRGGWLQGAAPAAALTRQALVRGQHCTCGWRGPA